MKLQCACDSSWTLEGLHALGTLQAVMVRNSSDGVLTWGMEIGMHGAAMAWTLIMHSHAAAVELWPTADGVWRCYEHTSHWAGLLYGYCATSCSEVAQMLIAVWGVQ